MLRKGFDPSGKRALVVGNGGVGSPIAASLAGIGLAGIGLFDPDAAASEALARRIGKHYPAVEVAIGSKDPEDYDLIVNATPIGMKDGDPLPVDIDRIAPGSYVGDVVLKAEITPFLQAAKDKDCTIQLGKRHAVRDDSRLSGVLRLRQRHPRRTAREWDPASPTRMVKAAVRSGSDGIGEAVEGRQI